MADVYETGRDLLPDAEAAWESTVGPYVRTGAVVVDVGAGTGRFARRFAQGFDANVVAVEPSDAMRRAGRELASDQQVHWLAGQAEQLPLRGGIAGLVWLCCVVHYLDLARAGTELARLLAPDGKLLVRSVFPDRFDDLAWLRWFPTARAIDEARMPAVEDLADIWRRSEPKRPRALGLPSTPK